MDHNMQSVRVNTQFHFLRMAFKILVSVSVFSFIFSQYSSLFLPLLIRSVDEYSSSFSVNQLFRYNSERNYIFLLCNGILVFIITNSGLIAKPRYSHDSQKEKPTVKPIAIEEKNQEEERKTGDDERVISNDHHHQEEEEEERKMGDDEGMISSDHHHQEEERKKGDDGRVIFSDHHHQEEEDEEHEVGDGDEEEGEDGIGMLSEEELDKKFDDFIKKMKQQIIMNK